MVIRFSILNIHHLFFFFFSKLYIYWKVLEFGKEEATVRKGVFCSIVAENVASWLSTSEDSGVEVVWKCEGMAYVGMLSCSVSLFVHPPPPPPPPPPQGKLLLVCCEPKSKGGLERPKQYQASASQHSFLLFALKISRMIFPVIQK